MSTRSERIGTRLRKLRGKRSQLVFSGLLGISRKQLNEIEQGKADIKLSTLEKIAEALDMTLESLIKE